MSSASATPRVLIFGGTFDPPHRAHAELPHAAARELGCDRILYIPAAINPLKVAPHLPPPTDAVHRLAMLRLALRDAKNAEISTIELDRGGGAGGGGSGGAGPSYTIDTLRTLAPSHTDMRLLIGADQALDFHRWKDWRVILEIATPAVMLRPPWTPLSFAAALRQRYDGAESKRWETRTLRTLPMLDVSATEVRSRIAAGKPLADLVSPTVEAYIRGHRLYANPIR